jgi:hypothetical protein
MRMEKIVDWLCSIVRIAGAAFPVTSSLIQLQAELDSDALLKRVQKLEDPVSCLHKDVPEVSKAIYEALRKKDDKNLSFNEVFYEQFSKPLAALESEGYIKGCHTIGKRFENGIYVSDPTFIMYMCALDKDSNKMAHLLEIVESCSIGQWLNGKKIQEEMGLPLPVIEACFDIYESKGYGICSNVVGSVLYMGKA